MCIDLRGDSGEGRVEGDVCHSSVHMSSEGVRVPFSWGGSAFYTYLSMIEGPMRHFLTVKNLPPPLFSEGNFITVHRCGTHFTLMHDTGKGYNVGDPQKFLGGKIHPRRQNFRRRT